MNTQKNFAPEKDSQRLAFVADVSKLLASSLDYQETLNNIAHSALPALGDWCVISLIDERGRIHSSCVAHTDPKKERLLKEWAERFPSKLEDAYGPGHTIQTGEPDVTTQVSDELLQMTASSPEHLDLMRRIGIRSSLCVPLIVQGRTIGGLGVGITEPGPRTAMDRDEVPFLEEFARRCAMAIENARLYAEARQAIQIRDDFISVASHELRTPLTPLRMQAQLLQKYEEHGVFRGIARSEDLAKIFEGLHQQIERFSRLVEDLLDVTRISADGLPLRRHKADLADIVREVLAQFEPTITKSGCKLTVNTTHISGIWDAQRLEQAVINLLTNAMKYGAGKPIEFSIAVSGDRALLFVTDHGIGIRGEDQEKIFDRFVRVAPLEHYGGLGLGLYITCKIVEAHGGTIRVESSPGRGATFTVELPLG